MSENRKNIPEEELNDETLDKVAGGKTKIINGRPTPVCKRCEEPLPHWYQYELCEECRKNPIG